MRVSTLTGSSFNTFVVRPVASSWKFLYLMSFFGRILSTGHILCLFVTKQNRRRTEVVKRTYCKLPRLNSLRKMHNLQNLKAVSLGSTELKQRLVLNFNFLEMSVLMALKACSSPGTRSPVSERSYICISTGWDYVQSFDKAVKVCTHTNTRTHGLATASCYQVFHSSYISPHADASHQPLCGLMCVFAHADACVTLPHTNSFVRPTWIKERWQRTGRKLCEEKEEEKKMTAGGERKKNKSKRGRIERRGGQRCCRPFVWAQIPASAFAMLGN